MAIVEVSSLKAKFEPGDSPKSSDFINLIDTLAALPVADVAANGIPSGGTTGQVLVKVDGTNYNTQWSTTDLSGKQDVVANVSSTEIGYLDGVTSAIQTQLNTKAATADVAELAQDAVGNGLSNLFTYNDSTGGISLDNAKVSDFLLDGASGNSYGLIGTSTYLDVKNTNGYNKEIELDIAAVKTQLNTDGYLTTSSTSTLTNKTLTSPKINEDVAVTATATELNYVDGVTSSIQTQINTKASTGKAIAMSIVFGG
jgi:hypothetical protein